MIQIHFIRLYLVTIQVYSEFDWTKEFQPQISSFMYWCSTFEQLETNIPTQKQTSLPCIFSIQDSQNAMQVYTILNESNPQVGILVLDLLIYQLVT